MWRWVRHWAIIKLFSGSLDFLRLLANINDLPQVGLKHESTNNDLIENVVSLCRIEDNIEFADVGEVGIEEFHKQVNRLEVGKFIVLNVHRNREEDSEGLPAGRQGLGEGQ